MKRIKVLLLAIILIGTAFAGCSPSKAEIVEIASAEGAGTVLAGSANSQETIDRLSDELSKVRDENKRLTEEIEALKNEAPAAGVSSDKANVETERKFLLKLDDIPEDMALRSKIYDIVQTYVSASPEMRLRQINGSYYFFTLKLPKDDIGLSRDEIEVKITKQEYEDLLKKQVGGSIYKRRFQFYEGDNYIFVDVYSGSLQGLAVAEIEFESVEASEKFVPPDWFGEDVTSDKRYKNASLAISGMPD